LLTRINATPIVALNRAIALAEVRGPAAALEALQAIAEQRVMQTYHLLPATMGEMHLRLGEPDEARRQFERALALTSSPAEQRFLAQKLARCQTG
jgi:predicted RNA polymerase sigma factor